MLSSLSVSGVVTFAPLVKWDLALNLRRKVRALSIPVLELMGMTPARAQGVCLLMALAQRLDPLPVATKGKPKPIEDTSCTNVFPTTGDMNSNSNSLDFPLQGSQGILKSIEEY